MSDHKNPYLSSENAILCNNKNNAYQRGRCTRARRPPCGEVSRRTSPPWLRGGRARARVGSQPRSNDNVAPKAEIRDRTQLCVSQAARTLYGRVGSAGETANVSHVFHPCGV